MANQPDYTYTADPNCPHCRGTGLIPTGKIGGNDPLYWCQCVKFQKQVKNNG